MHRRSVLRAIGAAPALASPVAGRSGNATGHRPGASWRTQDGSAVAANGRDLELAWARERDGFDEVPGLGADDRTVAFRDEATLAAFDAAEGDRRWEVEGGADALVAVDGGVYVHQADGTVRALSTDAGETHWEVGRGEPAFGFSSAAGEHDVLVGTEDDRLAAIAGGEVQWTRSYASTARFDAADGRVAIVHPTEDTVPPEVAVLGASNGAGLWSTQVDAIEDDRDARDWEVGSLVDDTVVLHSFEGAVLGVRADGGVQWRHGFDGEGVEVVDVAATVVGERVVAAAQVRPDEYAIDRELRIASIDHRSGETSTASLPVFAPFGYGGHDWPLLRAAVVEGVAYFPGGRSIVAFDPTAGDPWRVPGWSGVDAVEAADGSVVVATRPGLCVLAPRAEPCGEATIVDAAASYAPAVPDPPQLDAEVTVETGGCPTMVGVELVWDGTPRTVEGVPVGTDAAVPGGSRWRVEPGGETAHFRLSSPVDYPRGGGSATLVARGADGRVLDEEPVPVTDYRDEPGQFEITCAELDRSEVDAGESITATITVDNGGYAPGFAARLLVNGEVVSTVEGEARRTDDDVVRECEGVGVDLPYAFDDAGEYRLAAEVEAVGEADSGDRLSLGIVTVNDAGGSDPLRLQPGAILAGLGGGLLAARRLRRGDG